MSSVTEHTKVNTLALVAHDNCKLKMIDWVSRHRLPLQNKRLVTTGTTGRMIEDRLGKGLDILRVKSGPLGGDQQIGAKIAEGSIDALIFFWDPLEPMSHDPDIKALLRVATLWNIPIACNESSADFLVSSPLFKGYERVVPDFDAHNARQISTGIPVDEKMFVIPELGCQCMARRL